MVFGVWDLKFDVWCLVFDVWCLVFGVCRICTAPDFGFRAWVLGLRV